MKEERHKWLDLKHETLNVVIPCAPDTLRGSVGAADTHFSHFKKGVVSLDASLRMERIRATLAWDGVSEIKKNLFHILLTSETCCASVARIIIFLADQVT